MEVVLRPSAFPHCILGVNGGNLIIKVRMEGVRKGDGVGWGFRSSNI